MPWLGRLFPFEHAYIQERAPSTSGVYVLWNRGVWIYVGVTENLRAQLTALAAGENECVTQGAPKEFGFEVIGAQEQRAARQAALARELCPLCVCLG